MNKEIVLSVKRSNFRYDEPNTVEKDTEYKRLKPIILKKYDYSCVYCDYKSKKYQHIHHLDDNHNNNSENNLVVACPLCHMAHHIGFAGEKDMGKLIHIPNSDNFNQADLNNMLRALWVAKNSKADQKMAITAIKLLERFETMTAGAIKLIGTSDLSVLGDFLMGLSDKDYKKRKETLNGFYYLPNEKAYKKELSTWINNANSVPTSKWLSIASKKFDLILRKEG